MSDQKNNTPEKSSDSTAAPAKDGGPKTVKIQLGKDKPIEVTKPSAEYTQYVFGYGYKEVK